MEFQLVHERQRVLFAIERELTMKALALTLNLLWASTASPTEIACNESDVKMAVVRLMLQVLELQESAKLAAENLGVAALMDPGDPEAMFLTMHMMAMKEVKRLEGSIQSYRKMLEFVRDVRDDSAHCFDEPE